MKFLLHILRVVFVLTALNVYAIGSSGSDTLAIMQAAREIHQSQIEPLKLKGQTVRAAMGQLMEQGYLCGIKPERPFVPGKVLPPTGDCVMTHSHFHKNCDKLIITLFSKWSGAGLSMAELSKESDEVTVTQTDAFCPFTTVLPEEFLKQRPHAEATLTHWVSHLKLPEQTATKAVEALLLQGYFCGLPSANEAGSLKPQRVTCVKIAPGFPYCHEAELNLTVDWPEISSSKAGYLRQMPEAKVNAVQASCRIPALGAGKTG